MIIEDKPEWWGIINDKFALSPNGTRILIREDEFRTGLECTTCDGKGHTNEKCPLCKGTKFESSIDPETGENTVFMCRACAVGEKGGRQSYGFKLCPSCNGRTATIIIPETSERRPTSGVIIAIGKEVNEFSIGDHVLYSNYVGQKFDFEDVVLRTMHQSDVYCRIKNMQDKHKKLKKTMEEKPHQDLIDAGINTEV